MAELLFDFGLYFVPLLVAGGIAVLVLARKTSWFVLDAIWPLVPGVLWIALVDEVPRQRSLSNLFLELPLLGVAVAFAFGLRFQLGRRFTRAVASALMFPIVSVLTGGWLYVFPSLPE